MEEVEESDEDDVPVWKEGSNESVEQAVFGGRLSDVQ